MWPFWIGIGFSGRRAHSHLCSKADLIKAKGFFVFGIFAWFMHIIVFFLNWWWLTPSHVCKGIIFLKSSISFPAEDCWTPSPLGRGSKWTHHLCHYTQVDFSQDNKFAQPLLNFKLKIWIYLRFNPSSGKQNRWTSSKTSPLFDFLLALIYWHIFNQIVFFSDNSVIFT